MICPTCGRGVLPYDVAAPATDTAPAVWHWVCPIHCAHHLQQIGDPSRALLEQSLREWSPLRLARAVHISQPHDVYVGRAGHGHDGYFGNPIRPGESCPRCGKTHGWDAQLLVCYRHLLRRDIATRVGFRARFYGLRGLALACFCRRRGDEPCHAAIMADVLNADCRPRPAVEAALARASTVDRTGAEEWFL